MLDGYTTGHLNLNFSWKQIEFSAHVFYIRFSLSSHDPYSKLLSNQKSKHKYLLNLQK